MARLLKLPRLQFFESQLEIRQRPFCFLDFKLISAENLWVGSSLAEEFRGFEDLAFCLNALVDLLDLRVQLLRLLKRVQLIKF